MRADPDRLADILEAIARIERHAVEGRPRFDADELVQSWIVHHLLIIGEACAALSRDLRSAHPEVPWRSIIGMRNILVHNYFEVDREAVWRVVDQNLPELKLQLAQILEQVGPST